MKTNQDDIIIAAGGEELSTLDKVMYKYLNLKLSARPKEQGQNDIDSINQNSRLIQGKFDIAFNDVSMY